MEGICELPRSFDGFNVSIEILWLPRRSTSENVSKKS